MKFLADENVYVPIIEYLKSKGHEIIDIRETSLSGSSDDEIFRRAVKEKHLNTIGSDQGNLPIIKGYCPKDKCFQSLKSHFQD